MAGIDLEERRQKFPNRPQPSPAAPTPSPVINDPSPAPAPSPTPTVPSSLPNDLDYHPNTAVQTSSAGASNPDDVIRRLADEMRQRGSDVYSDPSSLEAYRQGRMSEDALRALAERRAGPTSHRSYDSQTTNPQQQAANAAADQRAGVNLTGPLQALAAGPLTARPQQMPSAQGGGVYGPGYQQAWNAIQNASKQFLGGYMTQQEIDSHLRNMGWKMDRDPDANILRSVQAWAPTLANAPEAQEYARRLAESQAQASSGSGGPGGPGGRPGQFTDPLASEAERAARDRADRLNNPPAGSGQALLEQNLREMAEKFRNGGYTNEELELFQTQALDPVERLRTARKQQVMQELSRRGLSQSSGIAQSMLADVDRQFDAMRAQQQTQLGTQAAGERRARMLQALELLSGLASTEEGRLDKAFGYTTYPLTLADRAFQQAMSVYGMSNPMNLFGPASQLAQMGMGQQAGQSQALSQLAWLLFQNGQLR
jgi:hypothetical protein